MKGRDRSYKVSIRNFLFTVPLVGGKLGQRAQVVPWAPLYSVTRKAELPPSSCRARSQAPVRGVAAPSPRGGWERVGVQSLPLLKSSMWARQARQATESKQWTLCSLDVSLSGSRFLESLLCSRGVGREECGGGRSDAGVGRGAERWVFFRVQVCLHLWFSSVYTPEMVPRHGIGCFSW